MPQNKKFKIKGEESLLLLGYIKELSQLLNEKQAKLDKLKKSLNQNEVSIKTVKKILIKLQEHQNTLEKKSHKERIYYSESPSTKEIFVDFIMCPRYIDYLYIKIDAAPTVDDGESLSIDLKVNGVSILDSPLLIDDSTEAQSLISKKVKTNKLKKGDCVTMDWIYIAGTANTLSKIKTNVHFYQR